VPDDPRLGSHTLIVARDGPPDPADDEALLRAVEDALSLPPEHLARPEGMDRPEFRLVEGVSAGTADQLAAVAVAHGYAPRVRGRLGIRYSNQRGQGAAAVGGTVLTATLAMLMVVAAEWIGGAAMLAFAVIFPLVLFVAWTLWRRSLFLPLAVPTRAWSARPAATAATDPASQAAREATTALADLQRAIDDHAPAVARGDLTRSLRQLTVRVDQLTERLPPPAGPSAAVAALEQRLATLDPGDPADAAEHRSVAAALADEAEAQRSADARRSASLAELLGIRRAAERAVADLQADDPERAAVAAHAPQIQPLRDADRETRQRQARAQQAAKATNPPHRDR